MPWELDNDRPIYLQLMERIQQDIIAGIYKPGDKIPSVRDLALDAAEGACGTGAQRTGVFPEDKRTVYHRGRGNAQKYEDAACQRAYPGIF